MAAATDFIPTPTTLPASITAPPTIQFTPPPECYDPANNLIITTSCYLQLPHEISYPNWLTCSLSQFGPSDYDDPSCYTEAPKVTQDGVVSYYSGCPVGMSAALTDLYPGWNTYSYDGHFDATYYQVACCPTQYHFEPNTYDDDPRQMTYTSHDGAEYSLFIYPLPYCAATSISELSGKEIPVQTWSNSKVWDKRQVQTITWDYEHGTMFAGGVYYSYTVFQSTHTCFEYCDSWFTYYYPGGVGGTPGPAWPTTSDVPVEVTTPSEVTLTPEPTSGPASETTPTEDASSPVGTPSQSVTVEETDTPVDEPPPSSTPTGSAEGMPSSHGDIPSSSSPSPSSIASAGGSPSDTSAESPIPTSGSIGPPNQSLLGVLMIGAAAMILS
ncbi:hypothetical protein HD806DRAFT_466393 [Xylariaceae sp. AK1471]|nr:hypothetical protein HD806DRAFT_466393 [Xylariaceae sp. AK1471]